MSMSNACRQIIWIQSLLGENCLSILDLLIYVVTTRVQGAIFLVSNPAQETHSKHIDITYICEVATAPLYLVCTHE
jgi:hypothetical protein